MPDAGPIRTDGSNQWALHTVRDRLPAIILKVITDNPGLSPGAAARLRRLREDLRHDAPLAMFHPPANDHQCWSAWFADQQEQMAPETPSWQNAQWFFVEHFLYRLILDSVRFFATGEDPFMAAKRSELDAPGLRRGLASVLSHAGQAESLVSRLRFSLWGNQLDLSHTEALRHSNAGGVAGERTDGPALIANDFARAAELIHELRRPVHFICDNAGTELVADLCLADWLSSVRGLAVHLRVKAHPTFVSDATDSDVEQVIRWMESEPVLSATGSWQDGVPAPGSLKDGSAAAVRELGTRLRAATGEGRITVNADPFWTSPLFMDQLPADILGQFAESGLIFIKGDMNYRRQLRDSMVPASDPLSDWATPLPAPALFLRTMKGDPVAGISARRLADLDREHPGWRTAGKHGVAQLLIPPGPPSRAADGPARTGP